MEMHWTDSRVRVNIILFMLKIQQQ